MRLSAIIKIVTVLVAVGNFHLHEGAKILMYPGAVRTHTSYFHKMGIGLAKQGHRVDLLVAQSLLKYYLHNSYDDSGGSYNLINYELSEPFSFAESMELSNYVYNLAFAKSFFEYLDAADKMIIGIKTNFFRECTDLMSNIRLRKQLNDTGYDFAIVDFAGVQCNFVLPLSMNVPYAALSIPWSTWIYRVPRLPSYTPFMGSPWHQHMPFYQRYLTLFQEFLTYKSYRDNKIYSDPLNYETAKYKNLTTFELCKKASLWFFLEDLSVSFPNALMPNTISVGDIIVDPGEPLAELPSELLKFMRPFTKFMGCVLVSFGSILQTLPEKTVNNFCRAFESFDKTMCFIWKHSGSIKDVCQNSKNIYLMPWLPQNSLLAHPDIKLFITHGGISSLMESVFFEKPMIVFPLIFDQFSNSAAVERKGYAISMVINKFHPEALINNIKKIIKKGSFYLRYVKFYSKILKNKTEKPEVRVSNLIHHVIEYGDVHLRSSAFDLNLVEFFMFDLFVLTFSGATLITIIIYAFMQLMLRLCKTKRFRMKVKRS